MLDLLRLEFLVVGNQELNAGPVEEPCLLSSPSFACVRACVLAFFFSFRVTTDSALCDQSLRAGYPSDFLKNIFLLPFYVCGFQGKRYLCDVTEEVALGRITKVVLGRQKPEPLCPGKLKITPPRDDMFSMSFVS